MVSRHCEAVNDPEDIRTARLYMVTAIFFFGLFSDTQPRSSRKRANLCINMTTRAIAPAISEVVHVHVSMEKVCQQLKQAFRYARFSRFPSS